MTEISQTFCRLPWTNINTTPQGSCKLCCSIADERNIMDWRSAPRTMDWSRDSIDEIWNGSYMQDVRRKMLNGERVHDCESCYQTESIGNTSSRMAANSDDMYALEGGYDVVASNLPISFELRLTNRCNLACHSCWGGSSSKVFEMRQRALQLNDNSELIIPPWLRGSWHGEVKTLSRKDRNYASSEDYVTQPRSIENFGRMAATLKRLYVTGGEPTMDKTIHAYLDLLVKADNWGCFVGWTTNCTLWNEPLMERLGYFENNELQLSVDAIGDINEYIRRPTVWADVDANVRRYLADKRVRSLKLFTVASAMNASVLRGLLDYLRKACNDAERKAIWWPIQLRYPEFQEMSVLPQDARNAIADDLEEYIFEARHYDDLLDYKDGLNNLINQLRRNTNGEDGRLRGQLREYLDYADALDRKLGSGNPDWRKSLPHLEQHL